MPPSQLNTTEMRGLLANLRAGDAGAADRLISEAVDRLEDRARQLMLKNRVLARWADTDELMQETRIRFHRSLLDARVQPGSMDAFYAIAGERMRLALLDLGRKIRGAHGLARHIESHPDLLAARSDSGDSQVLFDELDATLEDWERLHDSVPKLPAQQQAVFRMRYYGDLSDEEIAAELGIQPETVSQHFRRALHSLSKHVVRQDDSPELSGERK